MGEVIDLTSDGSDVEWLRDRSWDDIASNPDGRKPIDWRAEFATTEATKDVNPPPAPTKPTGYTLVNLTRISSSPDAKHVIWRGDVSKYFDGSETIGAMALEFARSVLGPLQLSAYELNGNILVIKISANSTCLIENDSTVEEELGNGHRTNGTHLQVLIEKKNITGLHKSIKNLLCGSLEHRNDSMRYAEENKELKKELAKLREKYEQKRIMTNVLEDTAKDALWKFDSALEQRNYYKWSLETLWGKVDWTFKPENWDKDKFEHRRNIGTDKTLTSAFFPKRIPRPHPRYNYINYDEAHRWDKAFPVDPSKIEGSLDNPAAFSTYGPEFDLQG